jgi:hypothetical protein
MNMKMVAIGGTFFGALAGAVGGYLFAERRLEAKYAQIAEDEISEARKYYKTLHKDGELSDPTKLLPKRNSGDTLTEIDKSSRPENTIGGDTSSVDLERIVAGLRYAPPGVNPGPAKLEFQNSKSEERFADVPYVVSEAEFIEANEEGVVHQVSYTYYAGDDVMVDGEEEIVDDWDKTVGRENLKFGHLSEDPRIVYIRNEWLEIDFEVTKHDGTYTEIVAGLNPTPEPAPAPKEKTDRVQIRRR